jgi:hypothetical protein
MSFTVWRASDVTERAAWVRAWNSWPDREVFGHPAYVELYRAEHDEAVCAAWTGNGTTVLYPLLIRPIRLIEDSMLVDLVTPYGYGGPFCWGERDKVDQSFWKEFDQWARDRNAVSEFIRFSLFDETLLSTYPGDRVTRLVNIVRSLDLTEEALWNDTEYKVRKNVKRARSAGITVECDPEARRFSEFSRIYKQTMNRRGALSSYYFPEEYFRNIHENLRGSFAYFHALSDGRVIASELVLLSERNAYSFLGGTDENSFEHRPNDLLKYEIIRWSASAGKRNFVLGGGYQAGDGIFRYKQSFAPSGQRDFRVGTRVLDGTAYESLVTLRQGQEPGWQPQPEFFPAYRA